MVAVGTTVVRALESAVDGVLDQQKLNGIPVFSSLLDSNFRLSTAW